jgi:hypothetical protein
MPDPNWQDIADALAAAIAAGEYKGAAIRASVSTSGRLQLPCVRVLSPALGFDAFGEGWRCDGSEWPVLLFTGSGGELSVGEDMDFLTAVLEAIEADPTLGGACQLAYPTVAESPEPIDYAGEPGAQARVLRRMLTIRMNH